LGTRHEVIANALQVRHTEVCARFTNYRLELVNNESSSSQFPETINQTSTPHWNKPEVWLESEIDCLAALAMLARGDRLLETTSNNPDSNQFLLELQKTARDPEERFRLLSTRYRHPLNIGLSSEEAICEHLLERLMVADRACAQQHSIEALYEPDLLLKLNLLAIKSASCNDLRYLDSLNYFYELIPMGWRPKSETAWLLITYLVFYARALEVCSCQIETCA